MTYTVGSLFTGGAAGIDLAFSLAGFEIVWQVEIDEFCRGVLKKNEQYWHGATQYVDVRGITGRSGKGWRGYQRVPYVDVMVGGFPCFAADTMILTIEGYKPIESLKAGELVLTHTGTWQKITSVMSRYADKTISINGMGILQTITTPEHPYYVRERKMVWDNNQRHYTRLFSDTEWVDAGELTTKHFASQVLPDVSDDDSSTDFWWLVGRYLADGWRVNRKNRKNSGRVVICAAHHEAEFLATKIKLAGFNATPVTERTVVKYHIVKNDLYRFLSQFGHKADGKTIPGWALQLSQEKTEALLLGYLSGDGSRYKNKTGDSVGWKCTTVSKSLALGVALLAQRAWGIVASVHEYERPAKTLIEGRSVSQKRQYQVMIADKQRSGYVEGNYGYKQIKSINETTGTAVYNISVECDESYIANGAIVHNCQDISVAGKRQGIREGARSGLWFEFLRLIGELRPRIVLLENVAGITHQNTAEVGILRQADALLVIGSLAAIGYDAKWQVISAADAGAPHTRNRWFCVGYANSARLPESPSASRGQYSRHIVRDIEVHQPDGIIPCPVEPTGKVLRTKRGLAHAHRQRRTERRGYRTETRKRSFRSGAVGNPQGKWQSSGQQPG